MPRANLSFLLLLFVALIFSLRVYGQEQLRPEIERIAKSINGSVGVGIKHLEKGDTLSVSGDRHFPMQSVYKFHLALAVLAQVDEGKLTTDKKILIERKDLLPNTWSPIAKKYPEGNVELTIKELLSYTVSQSDNNGCDILFRLVGGPLKVQNYIHGLGIKDVAILNTEEEMHTEWSMQFRNWTTPKAMVGLLDLFYMKKVLSPQSSALLMEVMEQTITGNKRIKGLLPMETVVGHKTGMGGTDDGYVGAINDVGVITLPNGDHLAVAFFISKTRENVEKLESAMAQISKLVFDHYAKNKP
jgi:beta-lactamase class A